VDLNNLIDFIKEADKLKSVERKTFNYNERRYENSGEHSWLLALAVLIFKDYSNENINMIKCLKMAIIHDLVEIDAGDTIIYADDKNKFDNEKKAAERIFSILPDHLKDELFDLWLEFEDKKTPEAAYVRALDRFLPLLSNVVHEGHTWKKHNISPDMVYNKNKSVISAGLQGLWNEADKLLKNCITRGYFPTKSK